MSKELVIAVLALIVALAGWVFPVAKVPLGGTTHFSGPIDSDAGYKESGTTIITTDKALQNITSGTFSGVVSVSDSASSTLKVGQNLGGGNYGTGCIVLGDSGGATSSPVYITASGSTISATTTKPDICQ